MNIKRILHGHYADPNSTRDITGLSGKHLESLISVLQTCVLGGEMLRQMPPQDAKQYVESFQGKKITDQEAQEMIAAELQGTKLLTEILEGINQPYEGAIYPQKVQTNV